MAYAIQAAGLGKRYALRRVSAPTQSLVDLIAGLARAPARWLKQEREAGQGVDFWALRDATFSVEAGQAIGIIGRNGAGKSTLMKLLSRITHPTTGQARLRGRVASLLEVGTGFHYELSGRENIYLNGAILGMRRHEVARRLDEIVEFAGVARFLDVPVKHYSTGMYLRLAFAVAAHLEAEILIVDEVLAVGDLSFQKKCLGMMESAATGGRTVLFVSHNLPAISRLTRRALLLDQGAIRFDGDTSEAIRLYAAIKERDTSDQQRRPVERITRNRSFRDNEGYVIREMGLAHGQSDCIPVGGAVRLEFVIEATSAFEGVRVIYTINSATGEPRLTGISPLINLNRGLQTLELTISEVDLVPGDYDFSINLGIGSWHDHKKENDSYMGFGRLTVTDALPGGQLFGSWEPQWGPAIHRRSRWRTLG